MMNLAKTIILSLERLFKISSSCIIVVSITGSIQYKDLTKSKLPLLFRTCRRRNDPFFFVSKKLSLDHTTSNQNPEQCTVGMSCKTRNIL